VVVAAAAALVVLLVVWVVAFILPLLRPRRDQAAVLRCRFHRRHRVSLVEHLWIQLTA
jgi:hypothetical protein